MEQQAFNFQIEPLSDETELEIYDDPENPNGERTLKVRLDKWLWAARFFKTRALARSAIQQGKVLYEGQKTAPTIEIALGANILLNLGNLRKSITVQKLSTRRRNSQEANELYADVATQRVGTGTGRFLRSGVLHRTAREQLYLVSDLDDELEKDRK